ncbi:paraquat-inducible protein B [Roseomonas alkaliterrae]|uniref:Paraquat-inducible protein B n=2 Tax=Neoroseomonas alkaliterrae TaxID=1452450 RepID=A0A840XVQ6_9PROT|nr:MlaD family protein [Neoroseomonas alkaliterrae]MBB5690719.1 paraquat-inducible protein B [Neoroseomonas alkaliterrae]
MAQPGRPLYLRVGMLVVVGAALAIGFVLFLTSGSLRGEMRMFETYVQESVAGLDVGAPVRFRGVQVGRVTELGLVSVLYGRQPRGPDEIASRLIVVRFAVDPARYGDAPVEDAVRAGLRVRIATTGVTGLSYLEVDFTDPARAPPMPVPWEPRFTVIPSVPSTITQVTSAAERLMTRLADLDIDGLVENAVGLLADLRQQVGAQGELGATLREAATAMAALRQAVEGAALETTLRDIREAARSVGAAGAAAERLVADPQVAGAAASIGQAAQDLRASVARLPAVIASLEAALRTVRSTTGDAQADLGPLLRDLRATVANLRDTAEALRRSPSQSLFGQPPPPPPRDRR